MKITQQKWLVGVQIFQLERTQLIYHLPLKFIFDRGKIKLIKVTLQFFRQMAATKKVHFGTIIFTPQGKNSETKEIADWKNILIWVIKI